MTESSILYLYFFSFQSVLDFDFVCSRSEPSVVAMVYPFTGDHKQKFYWGHKEILIPGKFLKFDALPAVSIALVPHIFIIFQCTRKWVMLWLSIQVLTFL